MTQADDVSHRTLDLLEARLRRLQYVVHGNIEEDPDSATDSRTTTAARLRTLERHLTSLAAKSATASQVLDLQRNNPAIFHPNSDADANELAPAALASLVLAHTRSYELMHKHLSTLSNLDIPEPSQLVPMVELQSRIDAAAAKQAELNGQVAELRARSARLLELWYTEGVLDMSEQWADWEERLRDVEILVRRVEAAKKREGGFV